MELTDEEIDIIKAARSLQSERAAGDGIARKKVSEATKKGYHKEYIRLVKLASGKQDELLESARDTKAASTWYRRKAAMSFVLHNDIEKNLKEQDRLQREMRTNDSPELAESFKKCLKTIKRNSNFIEKIQAAGPIPKEARKRRSTKKRSLNGLPDDWRENLSERMVKYKAAFLVAALTGCRPQELKDGVKLEINGDLITATIRGAKVTDTAGQAERKITFKNTGKLANELAALVSNNQIVSIESPANFSTAVRDAARRALKNNTDLTAYSLRHQFAADMKGNDFSKQDVSKAMGHVSDKTASYYGDRQQHRSGGPEIESVVATKSVKKVTNTSKKTVTKITKTAKSTRAAPKV